jgi:hypothetical protein
MKLFNFKKETPNVNWNTEDDGVMGGKSESRLCESPEGAKFEGSVSRKNFGGFCYVRSPKIEKDLTGYRAFKLETKSDGTAFRLLAYTSDRSKSYRSPLIEVGSEYETVEVPFKKLYPYFWGWKNPFATRFKPKNFKQIGFQTEYKSTGDFQINFKLVEVI